MLTFIVEVLLNALVAVGEYWLYRQMQKTPTARAESDLELPWGEPLGALIPLTKRPTDGTPA